MPNKEILYRSPIVYGEPVGEIDRENGIIHDVSLCAVGEALGHGDFCDEVFIDQVVEFGNDRKNGLKARFGHPTMSGNALGTYLGDFKDLYRSGDKAKGDLHLSDTAKKTPNGNLYDYVLDLAEEKPDKFGASVAFRRDFEATEKEEKVKHDGKELNRVRMKKLFACDLVDSPAANPDGLFSSETFAGQVSEFLDSNPEIFEVVSNDPSIIESFMTRYKEYKNRKEAAMPKDQETKKFEAGTEEKPAETASEKPAEEKPAKNAIPEENQKPEEKPAEESNDSKPEEKPKTDETPKTDDRKEFKRMKDDFGSDIAAETFAEGGNYADAQAKYIKKLETENKNLKEQHSAKPEGNNYSDGEDPAAFSVDDENITDEQRQYQQKKEELTDKIGSAKASFAAGLKLPK